MPRLTLFFAAVALLAPPAHADPHWSFKPRTQPVVPKFADQRDFVRGDIDAFVLKRLLDAGLKPAPPADRATLLRRLSFDLTGLPPTLAEVANFIKDPRPDAYERVVDRLLASPHYAERWAQHWLDVVRFAESDGFEYDRYRPGMWRYRDYVIKSLAEDRPFDRFVLEQIAGDVLEPSKQEMQVAVGFHRLGPVRRNAGNQDVAFSRNEVLTEMTDAIGFVFLGLTVGCARCHDHRFDEFSQEDYYRLQAFLAAANEHNLVLADAPTKQAWKVQTDGIETEIKLLKMQLEKATGVHKETLTAKLRKLEATLPPPLPAVCTIQDSNPPTDIHLLKRGMPEKKGKRLYPGFPVALEPATLESAAQARGPAVHPRLALARWLVEPSHPLTARVLVNRVWHYHFGRGLVDTPNDFGANGSAPTHPELLDHLANEFVRHGMKLRPLHRAIVLSGTYKQTSRSPDLHLGQTKDPGNRLLWQFPRRRLSAEEIRDAVLSVSGRLNLKAGGESVIVPVEKDLVNQLYDPAQWTVTADPREHDRRSIYLIAKRNLRLPFGQVFDQPDLATSCPRREASTHALQALELLNSKSVNRQAGAFAERLQREAGDDIHRQVELAFLLTTGRGPTAAEQALALSFLRDHPLREYALAMLNLNAFLYVD